MKKIKVMTIVGTRPEIIRLSRVIAKLDEYCEHVLVHTGQNYDYELNQIFFSDMGLRQPDYFLEAAGANASETIGQVIIAVDKLFTLEKPEALLVLGDTNSCLSVIPAKRHKIPIFHMEAGNRCFDQRVPEELNRKIVDHVSDINLTYSDIAREYLLKEGIPADRIIKTGSPMFEVLAYYKDKIAASNILDELNLVSGDYFVVSCHREENIDSELNLTNLIETLNRIAESYEIPIIVTTHPRTRKRLDQLSLDFNSRIMFIKPLGFTDYIRLQSHAKVVLSDSGTISEESSILNFSALNIREAHERPEAMEEAAVMMSGLRSERVLQCLDVLIRQAALGPRGRQVADYSMPNVSDKVVRLILSYTDYISQTVWKKVAVNHHVEK